jgi:hypothetical protein
MVSLPTREDPWGALAPLRGTVWGDQIQEVSGEALSHALHGWAVPLMREIGVDPQVRGPRIPEERGRCRLHDGCLGVTPQCRPGVAVPDCYEAPGDLPIATDVVLAWKEGRYVVVVGKGEFSF